MDAFKVTAGFFCGFLIVLFSLIIFIKSPEKAMYDKTINSIMIQEGLTSHQEVLDSFPEMNDIKSKMSRIEDLKNSISSKTRGPSPNLTEQENQQILEYTLQVRLLQDSIKSEMTHLAAVHIEERP